MSDADRQRWNARYREHPPQGRVPSTLLTRTAAPWLTALPDGAHALDVAGGAGRHALWLARLGFAVTLCDVSAVALDIAQGRAERAGLRVQTLERDLETEPFPHPPVFGPWQLVVCVDYLQRSMFEVLPQVMVPGGLLVFAQPTRRNLERHARPAARFLLDAGELPGLLGSRFEILHHREDWSDEARHEARLVARLSDEV